MKNVFRRGLFVLLLAAAFLPGAAIAGQPPAYRPGPMLQRFLKGPMAGADEIIFASRPSGRDHWYVNFAYYSDKVNKSRSWSESDGVIWGYPEGAALCKLNLRTGKLAVLLEDRKGGVRDPQVHYDGRKVLFSYRKGGTRTFHLHEINIDGTGLKQLTGGPDDDIEPTYLPDGRILFCSSRCHRFVNCWYSRVAVLYTCNGDGGNIRMISSSIEHDNTPWTLPDGRVLYMRWEYVDRSQVHFHHLWTTNPDGTAQVAYYGNMHPGIAMLDAKPIPGTNKVVASFSPGHGRTEHMGFVTVVDPSNGPDHRPSARNVSRGPDYRDPYAFSESCFMAANRQGIHLMDGQGNTEVLFRLPARLAGQECHEPRPLQSRPRERIIPPRVDLAKATGRLFLSDIYHGRNMPGVKRGEIKKLLILEQLPKPVNFSGGMQPLTIFGTFTLARVLGTVPVEPDGSAFMELPAMRPLFFVALDKNDLSVKRMQSFLTVQPGETTGCIGCHEDRSQAPLISHGMTAFNNREPDRIEPIRGVPDVYDFPRDVQPVLDKHCVQCHGPDKRDGGVDLCGGRTPTYSVSYWTIYKRRLVSDGDNLPVSNLRPRAIGTSASRLMKLIDEHHYDVKLSERERNIVRLWIESSATFPGTYASLGCGMYSANLPQARLKARCGECHGKTVNGNKGPEFHYEFGPATDRPRGRTSIDSLCNATRPEDSIILRAPLSKKGGGLGLCKGTVFADRRDPDYQRIRSAIADLARRQRQGMRFDIPGFRPKPEYTREMRRFGIIPAHFRPTDVSDVYAVDEAYWKSFWYVPPAKKVTSGR